MRGEECGTPFYAIVLDDPYMLVADTMADAFAYAVLDVEVARWTNERQRCHPTSPVSATKPLSKAL